MINWSFLNKQKQAKKSEDIKASFFECMIELELQPSHVEIFTERVVGLDTVNRKILLLELYQKRYKSTVIELDDVIYCSHVTVFEKLAHDNSAKSTIILSDIFLELLLKDLSIIPIAFFQRTSDRFTNLIRREETVQQWEIMISKLIRPFSENLSNRNMYRGDTSAFSKNLRGF